METKNLTAKAETDINAPVDKVWDALVNPEIVKKYMFGTTVESDWKVGSKITWKGEWKGKAYEDKGVILQIQPGKLIQYSHYSPLSGLPDKPENYKNIVTTELTPNGKQTTISLKQDHNESEKSREESEKNWQMMLDSMKKVIEG
jgi:uncharacterized protein YndB with AHSA1/START domain